MDLIDHLGLVVLPSWHPLVLAQVRNILQHEPSPGRCLPFIDDRINFLEVCVDPVLNEGNMTKSYVRLDLIFETSNNNIK